MQSDETDRKNTADVTVEKANTLEQKNQTYSKTKDVTITVVELAILAISSILATVASIGLIMSEIHYYQNPDQTLSCDINPLVGCSSSVSAWQAHLLFGIPNSVVGLVAFTALATISLLLVFQVKLHKWIWTVLSIGMTLALVWVFWFLAVSIIVFHKLCPYCLVIWGATIFSWSTILGISAKNDCFLVPSLNEFIAKNRFYLAVVIIMVIMVSVLFGMMNTWIALL